MCIRDSFETDEGDGFREPGFSKERRLEPQITIGLLTEAPWPVGCQKRRTFHATC